MKKAVRITVIIALIALIVIQFIRPLENNGGYETVGTFETETHVSPELSVVIKENCYDCHSNQTQYPWYSKVAPISFWLSDHINDGKKHFNASAWSEYADKKKEHKLEELGDEVGHDEMPLSSYTLLHGDLTAAEKKMVLDWASAARATYQIKLKTSAN